MNDETLAVIDIDSEDVSESIESIQNWVSTQEAFYQSKLKNKPAFQRAMKELTTLYYFPAEVISRGRARNTQYSDIAIRAISLARDGKLPELEELRHRVAAVRSTSITRIDRHNQIARSASAKADENLLEIDTGIGNLLSKFSRLGEALGDQAASEIEAGFTRKVAERLKKLTEV